MTFLKPPRISNLVFHISTAVPRANLELQKACPFHNTPPPGVNVYSKDGYSLYEIDGSEHKLYAQNLSLFAKLFLDTKSVFYDVTTFLYYLLVAHNPVPSILHTNLDDDEQAKVERTGGQVVGFFSKEKMSWDNNNLACILIFPPWQKQGLGQILMGASYEMSRREGRLGGPEKRAFTLFILSFCLEFKANMPNSIIRSRSPSLHTLLVCNSRSYLTHTSLQENAHRPRSSRRNIHRARRHNRHTSIYGRPGLQEKRWCGGGYK